VLARITEQLNAMALTVAELESDLIVERERRAAAERALQARMEDEAEEKYNAFLGNAANIDKLDGRLGTVELALSNSPRRNRAMRYCACLMARPVPTKAIKGRRLAGAPSRRSSGVGRLSDAHMISGKPRQTTAEDIRSAVRLGRRSEDPRALREPLRTLPLFLLASCDSGHGATRGVVLNLEARTGPGGQELPRCLITNNHMSCGSRFPLKRKRSFPILEVRRTLKLAAAPVRQAAIP
jgi:hypothetical protein